MFYLDTDMWSCLFYTGCVLRSPWGTSNSTEPALHWKSSSIKKNKSCFLSESVTFALARVFLEWCFRCQVVLGTSLSVAFYAATLASPLPLKVHMHQSPARFCVPTMSKPPRDACSCREMIKICLHWRGCVG